MRHPSKPEINRDNPEKWFIFWNHDVPQPLWEKYNRRRTRIKVYDNINRYKGEAREQYARERREVWEYQLTHLNYNPFLKELEELETVIAVKTVKEEVKIKKVELTPEQARKFTPIRKAVELWIESRQGRTANKNSVSTYKVTARWLTKHFESNGRGEDGVNTVTRLEVATALLEARKAKGWEPTTYNNEYDTLINLFNWLEKEEYIDQNPIRGKIEKIKTNKHKHKWYDKKTKQLVKDHLLKIDELLVFRVMQFTYEILIRSKTELMKLKAGDIDRELKRVRFSAELSKNGVEAFRTYGEDFDKALAEMNFDSIPANFFIFGRGGEPSPYPAHKDLFASRWKPIREDLGLSDDYTIYGMKHTRIVHELMKKTDGYDISRMARHEDPKSTKDYQRDYDIELTNVYKLEDLKF